MSSKRFVQPFDLIFNYYLVKQNSRSTTHIFKINQGKFQKGSVIRPMKIKSSIRLDFMTKIAAIIIIKRIFLTVKGQHSLEEVKYFETQEEESPIIYFLTSSIDRFELSLLIYNPKKIHLFLVYPLCQNIFPIVSI